MIPLKAWMICFISLAVFASEPTPKKTRAAFVGTWEGGDRSGLWCRVQLDGDKGKMFTFRGDKHLSTLNFWWNLDRTKEKLVFGVNGEARALENGDLALMLKPVNTNIVTLRDAILKRVQSTDQPAK